MGSERERGEFFKLLGRAGAFPLKPFASPKTSIGGLDVDATAQLIAAAADVALVVDRDGVIRDVAFGSDELSQEANDSWVGQPWTRIVTVESRPKVEALLREAAWPASHKWRHVNHPSSTGIDVPVLYSALQVGNGGDERVIAFGRDLRSIAALQQRLVDAQQSIERDYFRLRQLETRYRMLFQMSTEPVLIVDAATQKVVEANPAATQLLGRTPKGVLGRSFPEGFDDSSTQAIQMMLSSVRAAGRADDVRVRLAESGHDFVVSASLVRQENSSLFLVRLSAQRAESATSTVPRAVLRAVENAPDGFVLTDTEGRILTANHAFIDLAQLATEEQARGESLERWLGRPGVDFKVLIVNMRQHGSVRLFATTLRGEQGSTVEVEISGVASLQGDQPCLGFILRSIGRRLESADPRAGRQLPRSVEQLTELVGRVSLKDLVRESTDLIERLCIEAALELTADNRASAAEMLGLSRQSLYVKLRRYGLGDLGAEGERLDSENSQV